MEVAKVKLAFGGLQLCRASDERHTLVSSRVGQVSGAEWGRLEWNSWQLQRGRVRVHVFHTDENNSLHRMFVKKVP